MSETKNEPTSAGKENVLKTTLTHGLRKQHTAGIKQGMYAVCKLIYGLADKEAIPVEERIQNIKTFCSVCIDSKEKKKEQNKEKK